MLTPENLLKRLQSKPPVVPNSQVDRIEKLMNVFTIFDGDKLGAVEVGELLCLGKLRKNLGQNSGLWSEEENNRHLIQIDGNRDGGISQVEFSESFESALPAHATDFDTVVEEFVVAACAYGNQKEALGKPLRRAKLLKVFGVFDLDGSGSIEASELLQLGKMRRQLGQSKGEWSEAKNNRMVKKMDENGDGVIDGPEFSEYFEQALPTDKRVFDLVVSQFTVMAQVCRERKQNQRAHARVRVSKEQMQSRTKRTRTRDNNLLNRLMAASGSIPGSATFKVELVMYRSQQWNSWICACRRSQPRWLIQLRKRPNARQTGCRSC